LTRERNLCDGMKNEFMKLKALIEKMNDEEKTLEDMNKLL